MLTDEVLIHTRSLGMPLDHMHFPFIGEGDLGYVENLEQQDIGQDSPSKSLVVREEIFILFRIQPFTESD